MRVAIYHNILWSKYKGVVFSEVHARGLSKGIDASFVQIAETEEGRTGLGGVDLSYHRYPFRLLFKGAYASTSLGQRVMALAKDLLSNPSDLVVMPGYHRVEYWAMLVVCLVLGRRRAVFCDSTPHDKDQSSWKGFAKRVFFRCCDGFFCYGIRSKDYLRSYGVNEAKINFRCQAAALPHGYDAQKILEGYKTHASNLGEVTRFVFVGRFSTEKGLDDLLASFLIVRASRPKSKLDLVGAGPIKGEIITRVAELGLERSVTFLGAKSIDDIALLFTECSALVLPSHSEPWGLVVNESLSYGCPVVVSDICGCVPDLVLDGVTGYSFGVGNVKALAAAMLAVADMSVDRVTVARNCLKVISAFTPARAAAQILDGCLRIAKEPG